MNMAIILAQFASSLPHLILLLIGLVLSVNR